MISRACDCTINQYIKCLYDNDYSVLGEGTEEELKEAFQKIETDYIDISGQFESKIYESIKNIVVLSSRIEFINTLLYIQEQCLREFNHPYLPALKDFGRFGYSVVWNGDVENFITQLKNVQSNEQRFIVELEDEKKNIKKGEEIESGKNGRSGFIKLILNLQKQNYVIDRDKTTMEDLGLMINEIQEMNLANEMSHER